MKENQKKAFDFAADTTKQLITLATAIITLTITFSKDILAASDANDKVIILIAWIAFVVSFFFGILTLMALTGNLQPIQDVAGNKPKEELDKKAADTKEEKDVRLRAIEEVVKVAAQNKISIIIEEIQGDDYSINKGNIRLLSGLQIFFFVGGLVCTIFFGYKIFSKKSNSNHNKDYKIIKETILGIDSTKYFDTVYIPR